MAVWALHSRILAWSRAPPVRRCAIGRRFSTPAARSPLAFVLDIDGVLLRGPHVLPAARRALAMLEGNNPLKMNIPYILLTNGGGISEVERSRKLSEMLGVKIKPSQCIQAHTILKTLVHNYADRPVLILGGKNNDLRSVVENYGFKKAYTTLDILAWNPAIWPFHELTPMERATIKEADFAKIPISAIMVLHDPRNWALDIQVMCDVIQSGGVIGSSGGNDNDNNKRRVELVFCNPDLLWRNDFERSRFGQGAFVTAFQAMHKSLTGSVYPYKQYGKPTTETFKFAQDVLIDHVAEIHSQRYLPQIYMIGDNPDSDIAGANAAKWTSVLVRTGVYDPRHGPSKHQPTHEVEDVEEAVRLAIDLELAETKND